MSRHPNSFSARATMTVGGDEYQVFRLDAVPAAAATGPLPFTLRVLLENLLRYEDGDTVTADDIRALAAWDPSQPPSREIAFTPSRVLLQDFTGVPAVVDLAAMRDAMAKLGGRPEQINPLLPAELVIDHSVQVDWFGSPDALANNTEREYQRNLERYKFLRWGQSAFDNFAVVPPSTGIVHQVNIEYLARVVFDGKAESGRVAYPDTVVGTDSHTTMVNALGVLGWGVGGIEAEAAMLGQPVSMLIPEVVGFRLLNALPEGATATDLVLTVVQMLRKKGVVGKFVEFIGSGLSALPLADRATIANMAPEYGATCGFFPVDDETLRYLRLTGRDARRVALVETYCREQGLFYSAKDVEPRYSDILELDLSTVEPSIAGPKRPQDRVSLKVAGKAFRDALPALLPQGAKETARIAVAVEIDGVATELRDGSVVIAAITSCTNTSNPSVMLAAGLVAKKAIQRDLVRQPWVKTSLAPGSRVVTEYLHAAGLDPYLDKLGFNTVGYGCTTCIGNSGPLPEAVAAAIQQQPLVLCAVLSGNRNFEGRIHPDVRANYLMSPPLVVAYAIAGRMDIDFETSPLGHDRHGKPVFLRDIWPSTKEVAETLGQSVQASMFARTYETVFAGDSQWQKIAAPVGQTFAWDAASTYIKHPPFFDNMTMSPAPVRDIVGARILAILGDSVTTDHISPAGSISAKGPAGTYLKEHGIETQEFNSYGSRRGNHEVMMRGTFANVRLKNRLAPGTEGGVTRHLPGGQTVSIFEASERYRRDGIATVVIAGKEYGTGSSRDWAGKGPALLGVRAVIAESYERIHRSNLIGMGVAPLQFVEGETAESLGLSGTETYETQGIPGVIDGSNPDRTVTVLATDEAGKTRSFRTLLRIDTPREAEYYAHGGILQYVLRNLAKSANPS